MAYPHKAIWQYMKKKPSDELIRRETHGLLAVIVGIIPPAERDPVAPVGKDTVVADRDPVGISPEILENTRGATERRFAINDPLLFVEVFPEKIEVAGCFEMVDRTVEHQSAVFETMREVVKKLPAEQCRHDRYWKEKPLPAGYPAVVVRGQATTGDNTVDVGMIHEVLSPGVQNTDDSYFCSEVFRVASKFHERFGD